MEELYGQFSELTGAPAHPFPLLLVTELKTDEEYRSYLSDLTDQSGNSSLLVRRGLSGYSEIVLLEEDRELARRILIHLALFQYLEACNRDTPFWIKAGLARYFETLPEEGDQSSIPFNWNAWEEWKSLSSTKTPSLNELLSLTEEEGEPHKDYHILAWGFLTYLMNGQGEEGRLLWETLTLIRTDKRDEWIGSIDGKAEEACAAYLSGLTRPEGEEVRLKQLYEESTREQVLAYIEEKELHHSWLGSYYEGLIHYDRGLFEQGLADFRKAEEQGAPKADVIYSQGLCLWELGRHSEATVYFNLAEKKREGIIPSDLNRLLDSP
ncbi:MAG: hypothetical protein PQJ60_04885 [Spirochaetales bacterium]|nr:hypothetical protein [Spirochaetales bacterium]